MDYWINKENQKTHWIVATGMHGVMESRKRKEFGDMLKSADLWVCDGISLVWLAKLKGFNLKSRVTGPDLFHCCYHPHDCNTVQPDQQGFQ